MSNLDPQPRNHRDARPPHTAEPPPPRLGRRVLGWTLMTCSLGLVSCQSLFVL